MIDAIKFRELVEAEAADTKNKTGAYHKLGAFLIAHADALLALVEAEAKIAASPYAPKET